MKWHHYAIILRHWGGAQDINATNRALQQCSDYPQFVCAVKVNWKSKKKMYLTRRKKVNQYASPFPHFAPPSIVIIISLFSSNMRSLKICIKHQRVQHSKTMQPSSTHIWHSFLLLLLLLNTSPFFIGWSSLMASFHMLEKTHTCMHAYT